MGNQKRFHNIRFILSIFLLGLGMSSVCYANQCDTQQIITPQGLAKLSQNALRAQLATTPDWLKNATNRGLDQAAKAINSTLPNFLIDGTLRGGAEFGKVEHSLKNMQMADLAYGEPTVTCEAGPKCKLKVPIKKLTFITDYKLSCKEPRCEGQPILEFEKLKLGFDQSTSKEPPVLEFDMNVVPGNSLANSLVVDPNSLKFDIPLHSMTGFNLDFDISNEAWLRIYERLKLPKPQVCEEEGRSLQLKDLIRQFAQIDEITIKLLYEELKPYIKNESSFLAAILVLQGAEIMKAVLAQQDGLASDEQKASMGMQTELRRLISQAVSSRAGEPLANVMNVALKKALFLRNEMSAAIPVLAPKRMIGDLNVEKGSALEEHPPHLVKVVSTATTENGDLVVHASSCEADKVQIAPARVVPAPGSDVAGSIPIAEVNRYFAKVTENPEQNKFTLRAGGNGFFAKVINRKSEVDVKKIEMITEKDKAGVIRPYVHFVIEEKVSSNSPVSKIKSLTIKDNEKVNEGWVEIVVDDQGKLRPNLDKARFKRKLKRKDALTQVGGFVSSAIGGLFLGQKIVNDKYRESIADAASKVDINAKLPYRVKSINSTEDGYINYSANLVDP